MSPELPTELATVQPTELPTVQPRRRRGRDLAVNVLCVAATVVALLFIAPSALGLSRYVITGGSMSGSIERGAVVLAETVPVSQLAVGDVITYVPPADSGISTLVTHRIVSIDGSTFRTQGDANPDVDPWTFELTSSVQARVVADVPYVGWAFIALADRTTRMVVIGVPAALIALLSLRDLAGGLRDRRRSRAGAVVAGSPGQPGFHGGSWRSPVTR
jgi:signal peptidase